MLVVVLDEADLREHTMFINRLHDPRRGRAVAHVPGFGGVAEQILASLELTPTQPRGVAMRQIWATAWLRAHERLDLFLYGSWRLSVKDFRWLTETADSTELNIWLVTHTAPPGPTAGLTWSWALFEHHWRRRRRNTRRRRTTRQSRHALPTPGPLPPWPWGLFEAMLHGRVPIPVVNEVAGRVVYPLNSRHIADTLYALLRSWRTPHQRALLLQIVQDTAFRNGVWVTYDPALLTTGVARESPQDNQPRYFP